MISVSSFGVRAFFVVRHALATKLDDTNTATAMAVPHVQTLDIVEMVSLDSKLSLIHI